MVLNFLKSKLHGAIVTHSELEYDGVKNPDFLFMVGAG